MTRPTLSSIAVLLALSACAPGRDQQAFRVQIENIGPQHEFSRSGTFATDAGPIGPGESVEVSFQAPPGARLSFATMFIPSNDLFFAPDPNGIPLWVNGAPNEGDITDRVRLWDAGTEINQEPGLGGDQAPRQPSPDAGAIDPDPSLDAAEDDFGNLPAVNEVIRATLMHDGRGTFTLRIENVSDDQTLQTSSGDSQAVPLSPGVWAVHTGESTLFEPGTTNRAEGLEQLAEDGDPSMLASFVDQRTGVSFSFTPGVWALHDTGNPLFVQGASADEALETLAEAGDPNPLADHLSGQLEVADLGTFEPVVDDVAGLPPDAAYIFTFSADDDERFSMASMLIPSNDLFVATEPRGLALFDEDGDPIDREITSHLRLWDAGTEVNAELGFDPDQAPFQVEPDLGEQEGEGIRPVEDLEQALDELPMLDEMLRVTITPIASEEDVFPGLVID